MENKLWSYENQHLLKTYITLWIVAGNPSDLKFDFRSYVKQYHLLTLPYLPLSKTNETFKTLVEQLKLAWGKSEGKNFMKKTLKEGAELARAYEIYRQKLMDLFAITNNSAKLQTRLSQTLYERGPLGISIRSPAARALFSGAPMHGWVLSKYSDYDADNKARYSHGSVVFRDGLGGIHEWEGDLTGKDKVVCCHYKIIGRGPAAGHDIEDNKLLTCGIDAAIVAGIFLQAGSTQADIEHLQDTSCLINPIAMKFLELQLYNWNTLELQDGENHQMATHRLKRTLVGEMSKFVCQKRSVQREVFVQAEEKTGKEKKTPKGLKKVTKEIQWVTEEDNNLSFSDVFAYFSSGLGQLKIKSVINLICKDCPTGGTLQPLLAPNERCPSSEFSLGIEPGTALPIEDCLRNIFQAEDLPELNDDSVENADFTPCKVCNSKNVQRRREVVGELPPRLAITLDSIRAVSAAGDEDSLNLQDLAMRRSIGIEYWAVGENNQTTRERQAYRWIGGVYGDTHHYRVFWRDGDEFGPIELKYYNGSPDPIILGGLKPDCPMTIIPRPWCLNPACLFLEKVEWDTAEKTFFI